MALREHHVGPPYLKRYLDAHVQATVGAEIYKMI